MKTNRIIFGIGFLLIFSSCGPSARDYEQSAEKPAKDSTDFISSSAAVENNKDTTRRFIRTAELKFKVKSVESSTYEIERITKNQGGFVTYTNLSSNIDNVSRDAVSADSALETTHYTVTNSITLRVPNTKLDTTLKEIAKAIDFLDYRIISAEDVALQIKANNLTQMRNLKNEERLTKAIDKRVNKLKETTNAEELVLNKQEQSDNASISNLSLNDKINFSTIKLEIYQRQATRRELISNDKNIEIYEPSFGSKILESLKTGWEVIETILLFLMKLWGVFILGLLGFLLFRKYVHKIM